MYTMKSENLIKDEQEEIEEIEWRVDGKIASILRNSGSTKESIEFTYDPMGNRIAKLVKPVNPNGTSNPAFVETNGLCT